MKALTGRDLCRLLERHGWTLQRVHGSHFIYTKPGYRARISVPVHGGQTVKKGLQYHLLKLAGIEEERR